MSVTSVGTFLGGGSGGLKGIVNFPVCKYGVQAGIMPIFQYSSQNFPVSLNLPSVTNSARDFSSSGNFVTGKEHTYNEIVCRDFTINSGHQWTIEGLNVVKASRNITIGGNGIVGVQKTNRGVFLDLTYDHSPNTTKDSGASNGSTTAPLGASGGGHGDNPTNTSGGVVDIPSIGDDANGIGGNGDIWDTDGARARAHGLSQVRGFGGGQPQAHGFPYGQNGFYDEYFGFGRSNQRSSYFVTDSAVATSSYSRVSPGHGGAAGGFKGGANACGGTCVSALVLIADSIEIAATLDLSGSNAGGSASTTIAGGSGGGHGGYVFLFANTINFNGGSIDVSGGDGGPGGNGATSSLYAGGGGGGGHCGLIYAQASSFLTNTTTKTGNVGTGGSAGSPSFNAFSDPAGNGSDGGYVQPWNTHYVEVEGSPF